MINSINEPDNIQEIIKQDMEHHQEAIFREISKYPDKTINYKLFDTILGYRNYQKVTYLDILVMYRTVLHEIRKNNEQ